jgi:hypothetical protein
MDKDYNEIFFDNSNEVENDEHKSEIELKFDNYDDFNRHDHSYNDY